MNHEEKAGPDEMRLADVEVHAPTNRPPGPAEVSLSDVEVHAPVRAEAPEDYPDASIVLLTIEENLDYLLGTLKAGAADHVLQDASQRELTDAVRQVLRGESQLDSELAVQLLKVLRRIEDKDEEPAKPPSKLLTPRELEVLRLLARGQTNREIAGELVLSPGTVRVHVQHIISKLGVSDRTEAAVHASELGLL